MVLTTNIHPDFPTSSFSSLSTTLSLKGFGVKLMITLMYGRDIDTVAFTNAGDRKYSEVKEQGFDSQDLIQQCPL